MRCIPRIVFSIATILAAGSCASQKADMILEAKDVQFLKVVEVPASSPTVLKVSGLAFHSALSVDRMTTKTEGTSLIVLVHLAPARGNASGSFDYQLSVPDAVTEMTFGTSTAPLWKRAQRP